MATKNKKLFNEILNVLHTDLNLNYTFVNTKLMPLKFNLSWNHLYMRVLCWNSVVKKLLVKLINRSISRWRWPNCQEICRLISQFFFDYNQLFWSNERIQLFTTLLEFQASNLSYNYFIPTRSLEFYYILKSKLSKVFGPLKTKRRKGRQNL